ncbi:Crp/Fnr family transcriptional regulator [Solitalea lacus]|uniref:Crp/Fnr family transcriptional regulator n=1 Tax=Solitalea lacus TaxID=2911172 RepID=UPI001EDC4D4E|nr:cyclic nucleotide-binding domain-containing protein [Solitalea lacus]UKJ05863.1 cyclic nucleotide-binding domain-containing protein [Solitalea lacus]
MTELTQYIKNIILSQQVNLSEEAWKDIQGIWKVENVKRKTILSEAGETERNLYFVTEGVQRVFYLDEQNREATLVFTYPYSFAGVLDSFLLQSPSKYYFETITASVLLKTTYEQFQAVQKKHPAFEMFNQKAVHYVLSGLLERMVELQSFSSEEKFKKLLNRSPHVLKHVPHKYLANYLGIDPTNFSKLMNTVKI